LQPLAAWLVARPQHAVMALAATLLLPLIQVLSGIIMVLLVLRQGVRLAVIECLLAGALLGVVAVVAGLPVAQVAVSMLTTWLPALLMAVVLQQTRSLTLTLQVSVLLAVLAVLGFHAFVPDQQAYWQPVMNVLLDWTRENKLYEQARLMESDPLMTANVLTMALVLSSWMLYAVYMLVGYWAFLSLPGETREYGRFSDLNLGRVLALIMALLSLLAFASGAAWLQSSAFVMFAVFWLQGLAVLHWMYASGHLPLLVVIVTYALLPVLHVFLILALAVLGYTDAWFGYRRRAAKTG
jgi:hypothetical protein